MAVVKRVIDGTNPSLLWFRIDSVVNGGTQADNDKTSMQEAAIWLRMAELAHEDGWTGLSIVNRVLECYLDCGTRPGGWDITPGGPSRLEWETFKEKSPFYTAWRPYPGTNRKMPDISGYRPSNFEAQGYYRAIIEGLAISEDGN
ncbi:hypothetical protein N7520_004461 [Penicillium odoratum]|uniref:uncharacterized protein n=1 Tax=Penicillium odoratum TaxID=1167516 RepID=UPI0025472002|nr:uncharacterized protein N7520_004461 [Penicillium odoratum]KAJ5764902.1 hypothetical protein N7520_004461 [Penicillium odoratum]